MGVNGPETHRVRSMRHTKIIATVGPTSGDAEVLSALIEAFFLPRANHFLFAPDVRPPGTGRSKKPWRARIGRS